MNNDGLRSEQMALTRTRIIDAVFELMAESHPAAISIPEVSRRSGVSIATIYRHFPNKEQLLEATAFAGVTPRDELLRRDPDPDNFGPYLDTTWSEMAAIEPMLRAQFSTRLGHDVRKRRNRNRDVVAVELLARKGFDPDRDETRRLARVAGCWVPQRCTSTNSICPAVRRSAIWRGCEDPVRRHPSRNRQRPITRRST